MVAPKVMHPPFFLIIYVGPQYQPDIGCMTGNIEPSNQHPIMFLSCCR